MKSMFTMGFAQQRFQPHRLGQDWGNLFPSLITAGAGAYGAVQQAEAAKDLKKAQQAAAAAAAANQAAAASNVQAAQLTNPTILGLPRDTAIMGGIGLIVLVGIAALLKSSSGGSSAPSSK